MSKGKSLPLVQGKIKEFFSMGLPLQGREPSPIVVPRAQREINTLLAFIQGERARGRDKPRPNQGQGYITLPQTHQGKRYVLTMVEAATRWLETYSVPHATAWNTILGLEKQVLWRHGTPERIESDNGTHFKNGLINTWAREHVIEWIYHIPYHAPAAGKVERCNGLLKTTLKALWEDLQKLGSELSKDHLDGQHSRVNESSWSCPV
ncbi:hypothetical protein DUI87_11257 [Hirundo rustica rustica]|uniref:Integrase catalytic domain-containing protein n=1 Tax=Hirundo rustica rustica TaxID=333673 RepID=A0A3M0KG21_HIRRU|nr:hypothetical protein DUI87_11257 [Hirundo rustica rustica]